MNNIFRFTSLIAGTLGRVGGALPGRILSSLPAFVDIFFVLQSCFCGTCTTQEWRVGVVRHQVSSFTAGGNHDRRDNVFRERCRARGRESTLYADTTRFGNMEDLLSMDLKFKFS